MAKARVEVIVLHFVVGLIIGPVVHVEAIDRSENSSAMTAAGAVDEHDARRRIVNQLQESGNRLLLRITRIAHGNVYVAHSSRLSVALLVACGAIGQVDYGLNAKGGKVFVVFF